MFTVENPEYRKYTVLKCSFQKRKMTHKYQIEHTLNFLLS